MDITQSPGLPLAVLCLPLLALSWGLLRLRQTVLAARWARFASRFGTGSQLLVVRHVYQKAHRGSKAWAHLVDDGTYRDVWFHGWWASARQCAVVRGETAYGPHSGRDGVVFVNPGCLLGVAPESHYRAWQAVRRRQQRRPDGRAGRS